MLSFETGPIRPPSEAGSVLLRLTRNCPWNRCAFCPVYKGQKFSFRTVDEVKADIDVISSISDLFDKEKISSINSNALSMDEILQKISVENDISPESVRQVAFWKYHKMENLFLQDADSMVLKTDNIVEILNYIREKIPSIKRITTYSRAKTMSKKTPEDLKRIRESGLNRIHIGFESGSDDVLSLIKKGVTAEEQIKAGKNIVDAGFELSEYFMPGLGGEEFSEKNALESARVLSEINPTFIRIRSTIPVPGTPLHDMMINGEWSPIDEDGKVKEIELLIKNLTGITSVVKSDHIMNLLEDIEGTLPEDKDDMLGKIDSFLNMKIEDRENFIIGRRIGRYRYLSDYNGTTAEITSIKDRLVSQFGSVEKGVLDILTNYI